MCVCVCTCAGVATRGLSFPWTARYHLCNFGLWSVGFGRAQQTIRLLGDLVSIPCTLLEIPWTTKSPPTGDWQQLQLLSTYCVLGTGWCTLYALTFKIFATTLWDNCYYYHHFIDEVYITILYWGSRRLSISLPKITQLVSDGAGIWITMPLNVSWR